MGVSWHTFGRLPDPGVPVGWFAVSFARGGRLRAEFYIDSDEKDRNKRAFDAFLDQRDAVEKAFGEKLSWERLNNRRASRIAAYREGSITSEELTTLIDWAAEALLRLRLAVLSQMDGALADL
jgi:hypothetical protein